MRIVSRREHKTHVSYRHQFSRTDCPGAGFSFDCTADGTLLNMNPDANRNYQDCLTRSDLIDDGIIKSERDYWEPAVGLCDECGNQVRLSRFTNTCSCGADYNMSGSRLAPREQWGEETGESASDILRGDY